MMNKPMQFIHIFFEMYIGIITYRKDNDNEV
jgi:hypothetical protein